MNRSIDLRKLFRESLNKKRTNISPMYRNYGGKSRSDDYSINFPLDLRVYFYEWSDTSKVPKTFYDLGVLDGYLKTCGIYLQLYEKDIIKNLGNVYMSCYKGKRDLCIRGTYKSLTEAMSKHDEINAVLRDCNPPPSNGVSSIQRPSIITDPQGRWSEEGHFFG